MTRLTTVARALISPGFVNLPEEWCHYAYKPEP
ncbi:hypothetical protein C1703_05520 [Streptomyces sp. Go-475]|nr:hypothetical protein C1703_05520 [Streptomyces sp. Go-475]